MDQYDDSESTYIMRMRHNHPQNGTAAGTGKSSITLVEFQDMQLMDWDESLYGDYEKLSAMYDRLDHERIDTEVEALCRAHPDFPTGWNEITFRYAQWQEDIFTLTFLYEMDNGHRGLVDYNFLDGSITRID